MKNLLAVRFTCFSFVFTLHVWACMYGAHDTYLYFNAKRVSIIYLFYLDMYYYHHHHHHHLHRHHHHCCHHCHCHQCWWVIIDVVWLPYSTHSIITKSGLFHLSRLKISPRVKCFCWQHHLSECQSARDPCVTMAI